MTAPVAPAGPAATPVAGPGPAHRLRRRRAGAVAVVALAVAVLAAACGEPDPPPPPAPPEVTTTTTTAPVVCDAPAGSSASHVVVMGPCPRLNPDQIVWWFFANTKVPYNGTVPLADLVRMFLDEGRAEGVRGDVAFAQSIVETGWFQFPGGVPASANNFSGLGATGAPGVYLTFPDARTGVRAQIQHLRAYADATATSCAVPPLHFACVDPRFTYVSPKGKAPTWNQFGGGIWAADPGYAPKVLGVYTNMLALVSLTLA
ncbi:MAG: glucosaminidase domain-containing protein [Actinomycetes bacterium]